jgi:hypothetical protein
MTGHKTLASIDQVCYNASHKRGSLLKQATLRLRWSNQGGLKRNFITSIAT